MPAEAARFYRRIGPRDRWFILLAVVATVVAVVAIAIGSRGSAEARSASRCVAIVSPGFMGATRTEYCDAKATAICRSHADVEHDLAARCAGLDPALRP
jgi:hypothetical protein